MRIIIFFLRSLQKQKVHIAQKAEKEKMLLFHTSELASQMLQLVHEHGRLAINDIEKMTGANRNTIKKQLSDLVKKNILLRLGKGRGTWYALP